MISICVLVFLFAKLEECEHELGFFYKKWVNNMWQDFYCCCYFVRLIQISHFLSSLRQIQETLLFSLDSSLLASVPGFLLSDLHSRKQTDEILSLGASRKLSALPFLPAPWLGGASFLWPCVVGPQATLRSQFYDSETSGQYQQASMSLYWAGCLQQDEIGLPACLFT